MIRFTTGEDGKTVRMRADVDEDGDFSIWANGVRIAYIDHDDGRLYRMNLSGTGLPLAVDDRGLLKMAV